VNYYNRRVQQLNRKLYGKEYLTRQVILAKRFVDKHFAESIDLNKMARQAHLSKYHFLRIFKSHYGRSPYRYVVELRIAKAKTLLWAGNSVSETCYAVGFESVPSFSRMFKKIVGMTPGNFQRQKRKSNFG
jgi:AraC-like DNA-binding protein